MNLVDKVGREMIDRSCLNSSWISRPLVIEMTQLCEKNCLFDYPAQLLSQKYMYVSARDSCLDICDGILSRDHRLKAG